MCSSTRLHTIRSADRAAHGQGRVRSATVNVTLSDGTFSLALASMPSEKSRACTLAPMLASKAVFFPVPQPISKTELKRRLAGLPE